MRRIIPFVILCVLAGTTSSHADYLGVFTTSDSVPAPFLVGDSTLAHDPGAPDSFQVLVTRNGVLTASLSDAAAGGWADWIDIHQPFAAGSDSTWFFTELVADIDDGNDGLHWIVLKAYYETEYMQASHCFQISGSNTNAFYDSMTNAIHADNKANFKATGFSTHSASDVKALWGDTLSLTTTRVLLGIPNAAWATDGGLITNQTGSVASGGGSVLTLTAGGGIQTVASYLWDGQTDAIDDDMVADGTMDWGGELDTTGWGTKIDNRPVIGDTNSQSGIEFALQEVITARNLARDSTKADYHSSGDTNTAVGVGCGSGPKTLTFYVIDSTSDDTISNASVYILNSAQTAVMGYGLTSGSPPSFQMGASASTDYNWLAFAAGYFFPPQSFSTTSGVTPDTVDISGYPISTTATPASHQTTLTGQTVLQTDTLANCMVEITLAGATAMYSSTNTYPTGRVVVYSDANGDWSATIVGTDSLSAYLPSGSNVPTYCVKYKHPAIQGGGIFEACGLSIPANGSTTELRDILDQ